MTFLFFRAHSHCLSLSRLNKTRLSVLRTCRKYATHRDPLRPSPLSQSLDTQHQPLRPGQKFGPFQMGMNESPFAAAKQKKWSDLSTGGKLKRTTARTTNLVVIVFGAGLTAVLLYAVTSELFSQNSPTVLYGEACERIKNSPQVAKYLHGPLSFPTTRPTSDRPRGRQHQVTSQIFHDSNGREHMIINFFVRGSEPGSFRYEESSYYAATMNWISRTAEILPNLTLDEAIEWTKDRSARTWEGFVGSFRHLVGAPAPRSSTSSSSESASAASSSLASKNTTTETNTGKWMGMFSSLRKTHNEPTAVEVAHPEASGGVYTDGEVHAEFVRNDDGHFVCRYILLDIPNTRSWNPIRVFVQRTAGVQENVPVLRRNS